MLIRITNYCTMGCSHCFLDASPKGEHMSKETFGKALEITKKIDGVVLLISGGEPTQHPLSLDFFKLAKSYMKYNTITQMIILSNGMFLENPDYTKKVLSYNIPFQITVDPEYYPKKIKQHSHPLILYEKKLRCLLPFGRAVKNFKTFSNHTPMCFNIRSLCRKLDNISDSIRYLRELNKYCTPSINIDGTISVGELPTCHIIGNVDSSLDELTYNIQHMKCGKCPLVKNLPRECKTLWEEMEDN